MTEEKKGKCDDPDCGCGDDESCDCELEVIELKDENGEMEEFVILDELDFEGRHFAIMTPLLEVEGWQGDDGDEADPDLYIFECDGSNYTELDDEDLAERLMAHLDELADDEDGEDGEDDEDDEDGEAAAEEEEG